MMVRVVYVGAGLSGRATTVSSIMRRAGVDADPLTLAPNTEHVFVLDGGRRVSAQIADTRSVVRYANVADRDLPERVRIERESLALADGIVFVADSQRERMPANVEKLAEMCADLRGAPSEKPVVFQLNKRDLASSLPVVEMRTKLTTARCRYVESVATRGIGTMEALEALLELVGPEPPDGR
jgi:hypothetical protein